MYRQLVNITGPIDLVLRPQMYQKIVEQRERYPHLPEPQHIVADLKELGLHGGVPVRLENKEGQVILFLYTSSYWVKAYPTNRQDGYNIGHVGPLDVWGHRQLSKGVLMVQCASWAIFAELRQLQGRNNHFSAIVAAWQQLEVRRRSAPATSAQEPERLTPAHENYLNMICTLVEITHKLEQDQNKLPALISYKSVESAGEERYARDIYTFGLYGTHQINVKNLLRLKDQPDLQGRVLSLKGDRLTVKFESTVDRSRIRDQGYFEPIVGGAIYRTQQQAIETLRAGESQNRYLLRVLVDRMYQSYRPDGVLPEQSLNAEQLAAFQRALAVPDMLLVLGPPGTGKTRTITEIVRQCGVRWQRTLKPSAM